MGTVGNVFLRGQWYGTNWNGSPDDLGQALKEIAEQTTDEYDILQRLKSDSRFENLEVGYIDGSWGYDYKITNSGRVKCTEQNGASYFVKSKDKCGSFNDMVAKQRGKNIQKTIYGTASFESLYRGFDELGTAEQWWIITYLKDKLGMNGFEEFIDNVVAYAHDKYEGQ